MYQPGWIDLLPCVYIATVYCRFSVIMFTCLITIYITLVACLDLLDISPYVLLVFIPCIMFSLVQLQSPNTLTIIRSIA